MGGETLRCSGVRGQPGSIPAPSQIRGSVGSPSSPHIIHAREAEPEHPCLYPPPAAVSHTGNFASFCRKTFFQEHNFSGKYFLWEIIMGGLQEIRPCWELSCTGGTFSWWWSEISLFLVGLDAENFDFGICVGGRWFGAANCQQMH